jgi:hypothetical protein
MRTKRAASIFAKTHITLIRFNPLVMKKISSDCQIKFLRAFLRTLIIRLTATIERLTQPA